MRPTPFVCLAAVLAAAGLCGGEPKAPDPADEARRALAALKVGTSPPELVRFLRDLAVRPDDTDTARALLARLADESYDRREAASRDLLGLPARCRPVVAAAVEAGDPEVARRAQAYLDRTPDRLTESAVGAALTLIEREPPADAFAAAWELLPTAADVPGVSERLVEGLARLHGDRSEARPELAEALRSPDPARRLWAGEALALSGPRGRAQTRPLWADADGRVRARVALACAERGEREAVPALIRSLADAPPAQASQAEDFLFRMVPAGTTPPPAWADAPGARQLCREGWERWWRDNAAKTDLARLSGDALRGHTLVSEMDLNAGFAKGRIYELGPDNKPLWELALASAVTDLQRLPDGHLLVTEWATRTVKEIDKTFATTGKVYWSYVADASPILGVRLPGGGTVVGTESKAVVVDAKGAVTHTLDTGGASVKHGQRLRNGHILLLTGSEVVEYGADFKRLRSLSHGQQFQGWGSVEALANGRYLVSDCVANKAVELTPEGKEVWKSECPNPRRTQRLPDGTTLIGLVSGKAIVRVGRDGKEESRFDAQGGIYALIRY